MDLNSRRQAIIKILESSASPVTGSKLAEAMEVSRQVIVQDIALLKASGVDVISTSEGYMIYRLEKNRYRRVLALKHSSKEIHDELEMIIDLGGEVLDVIVTHPIYGEISANMMIKSRRQLDAFMKKLKEEDFVPLMGLTRGIHYHTIQASDDNILDEIEAALKKKGYLLDL